MSKASHDRRMAEAGALRHLTCAVCGSDAGRWRQHWNRDAGYGLCADCGDDFLPKHGYSPADIDRDYGKRGVNWGKPGDAVAAEPKREARSLSDYREMALEELATDFTVVKDWVWNEIERNRAAFVHSIAEIFSGEPNDETDRLIDIQRNVRLTAYIEQDKSEQLAAKIAELQDSDREDED